MECTATNIATLTDVVESLRSSGYHARMTDEGVLTGVSLTEEDGSSKEFAMLISEQEGSLELTCQICTIGDLEKNHAEDLLVALAWVFLAINTEIQPWAIGLINPDGEVDSTDVIVLTDSLPLGDLSIEELASAMSSLERAVAHVVPTYVS